MGIPRTGNTTTQACAACKYQRRKCVPDCILAPYFPHDRQKQFLNAHKLFGVSNITKIIKNLDPIDQQEAMRSIIIQSDVRAIDPVGGCYRIIRELQRQIDYYQAELDIVLHQLSICRSSSSQVHQHHNNNNQSSTQIPETDFVNNFDPLLHYQFLQMQHQEQFIDQNDVNAWNNNVHDDDEQHFVNKCDDIKPILDENDDLKFDPEEIVDRSEEGMLKIENEESIQQAHHQQDHDLEGGPTMFTLTKCNS